MRKRLTDMRAGMASSFDFFSFTQEYGYRRFRKSPLWGPFSRVVGFTPLTRQLCVKTTREVARFRWNVACENGCLVCRTRWKHLREVPCHEDPSGPPWLKSTEAEMHRKPKRQTFKIKAVKEEAHLVEGEPIRSGSYTHERQCMGVCLNVLEALVWPRHPQLLYETRTRARLVGCECKWRIQRTDLFYSSFYSSYISFISSLHERIQVEILKDSLTLGQTEDQWMRS